MQPLATFIINLIKIGVKLKEKKLYLQNVAQMQELNRNY